MVLATYARGAKSMYPPVDGGVGKAWVDGSIGFLPDDGRTMELMTQAVKRGEYASAGIWQVLAASNAIVLSYKSMWLEWAVWSKMVAFALLTVPLVQVVIQKW